MSAQLLSPTDPPPFDVLTEGADSPFLLIGDHAGNLVPRALAQLGLPQHELERHIGWDLGVRGVAEQLSQQLGATAILQRYSRLVIDCNRPPGVASSIAQRSDGSEIPGNLHISSEQAQTRAEAIFWPYHRRIAAELDARMRAGKLVVLLSLHSFTPVWQGAQRPWHGGTLYHRDARLARALRGMLQQQHPALLIGDNQPYAASPETDYAIPVHGEARGILHVGFEMRQDLLADAAGQQRWAARLQAALNALNLPALARS